MAENGAFVSSVIPDSTSKGPEEPLADEDNLFDLESLHLSLSLGRNLLFLFPELLLPACDDDSPTASTRKCDANVKNLVTDAYGAGRYSGAQK